MLNFHPMTDDLARKSFLSGWQRAAGEPSLADVYASVRVRRDGGLLRRALAFVGPGFLVAVGYMDPGNWATSIAGGAQFGYALLFVALLSNIMAIILQALSARLAIGAGRDLAQACRDAYPKPVAFVLWVFAEIAIIATDLAEVVGTAIGLNLLFGIPLELGVLITAIDVFLVLALQRLGFRWIEAFIMSLLGVIFVSFLLQIALADPDWRAVIGGFAPSFEIVKNPGMLYLALGIIGATVMPHNLYLHSGIVQTRDYGQGEPERREALRYATWDFDHRADVCAADQCFDPDPRGGHVPCQRPHHGDGYWRSAFDAGAAGGVSACTQTLRVGAAGLRPQLHDHRHLGRTDRDGGLP